MLHNTKKIKRVNYVQDYLTDRLVKFYRVSSSVNVPRLINPFIFYY